MDSKILKINNNDTYTIQYTGQQLEYALGKILGLQLVNNNSSVDITLNNITYTLIKKEFRWSYESTRRKNHGSWRHINYPTINIVRGEKND